MIALDYRRDPSTTWEHVGDVHADDLRDHLSWWSGPSLTTGDLVRAVGDGHESLYVWLDSGLWDVRDERGPLTASQWDGDDADAVEMLRRCAGVDRRLVVLAACDCAETALRYVPPGEDRPRRAIETARAWARGQATLAQVRAASSAASAFVDAAYAVSAYAASSAASASAFAAASSAAFVFADAAASYAASSASATWLSARASSLRSMAPLVRRHIPLAVVARSIVDARRALAA